MNPDGRSQRRRRGAFAAVLIAAAGAALAAAMIPAAPAYAVGGGDTVINGDETNWLDQTSSGLNPSDLVRLATADEKLTDTFLTQLGPLGLASSFETQLESGFADDFSGITPGTLPEVVTLPGVSPPGEFDIFVSDYGLPVADDTSMYNTLTTLQTDGLSAPLLSGLEGDLFVIFQGFVSDYIPPIT